MSSYYLPDLTGQNPEYARIGDIYTLYETNQKIFFTPWSPIYASSLSVVTTDGTGTPLVLGVDYVVNTDDIDTTTVSRAKNGSPGFNSVLLKSITITRNANLLPLQVAMAYQEFYLTTPSSPIATGSGEIDVTPDLLIDMLRRITAVEQTAAMVPSVLSSSSATPLLLDYDINGILPANVVSGEIHLVNTFGTNKVIRPVQGAFFKDSVSITAGGNPLVQNTDYLVISIDLGRTKVTTNTSGIYNLILLTVGYAGSVTIGYHAVGGEVSVQDLTAVYGQTKAITDFLNTAGFVTSESLPDTTAFQNLVNIVKNVETQVRSLLSGQPTYGDTTTGTTVPKQIRANDTNLHWWTIATLYQVAGSTDIVQADRISLHIQLSSQQYLADIDVAFDINNLNCPLTAEAHNVIYDPGFQLYGVVNALPSPVPMIRAIYNTTQNNVTGVALQIGLSLPGLTDTLTIEDRSGIESCWLLNLNKGSVSTPILPSDDAVILPDGISVWSSTGTTSVQIAQTLQNSTGYLLYAGQVKLTLMDDSAPTSSYALPNSLPNYFRVQDIKSLNVHLMDVSGNTYLSTIPMCGNTSTTRRGVAMIPVSAGDAAGLLEVDIDSATSPITVSTRVYGQAVIADALAIRYIIAIV